MQINCNEDSFYFFGRENCILDVNKSYEFCIYSSTLFIEFSGRRIKKVRREIEAVVVTGTRRKGETKSTRRTRCVLSSRQANSDHSFRFQERDRDRRDKEHSKKRDRKESEQTDKRDEPPAKKESRRDPADEVNGEPMTDQ